MAGNRLTTESGDPLVDQFGNFLTDDVGVVGDTSLAPSLFAESDVLFSPITGGGGVSTAYRYSVFNM